jgi:predicted dehydrogenase
MRVGIIGGGFGLKVQAPIIETHPFMKVVAVSTVKRHQLPEGLQKATNTFVHYKNWKEMLEQEELDLLFISSIPIYHYEISKYALEKGINVVCEKPFTTNSKESRELCELVERYNVKVVLDFEWRYLPIRQKVKEMLLHKEIGEVKHFEYHVSTAQYQRLFEIKRGWMGEKQKSGGMLGALGSHMIDSLRWLLNDEVHIVNGLVHTHVTEGVGEVRDADDAFFIHGKVNNGTTFSIQLVSGINHGYGSHLRIFGDLGTIAVSNDKHLYFAKANEQLTEIHLPSSQEIPSCLPDRAKDYYSAFYPFLEKIHEYMTNGTIHRDLPTIVDGHENQVIIDKIRGIYKEE